MKRIIGGMFAAVVFCIAGSACAWGQTQIQGTVKDPSGAILPGVEIKAIQTDTGVIRERVTNETGGYVPNVGTDTDSATFRCSGTASAFPGAPPCSNGSVTYQFIPYDKDKVITGDPNGWFNPLMFRLAPTGVLGNAARGMLRAPGLSTWDLSLNKDTALPFLGENTKLQFRGEIFNLLNHANFSIPASIGRVFVGTLTDPTGASEAPIPNVGRITTTATSSRQIQLALKVIF